eukprot:COSAG01_NODE_10442_length_2164_cov_2.863923_1_plen_57_part_00
MVPDGTMVLGTVKDLARPDFLTFSSSRFSETSVRFFSQLPQGVLQKNKTENFLALS